MSDASDIVSGDWVDRFLPSPARPYARLARIDRPIGTWLLYFPCVWGILLGWQVAGGETTKAALLEVAWLILLFGIGALVMRGAGCTINDFLDREMDRKVARTATRPIASGAISPKRALVFMVFELTAGLVILLQLSPLAQMLGVGVLLLVFTYPLAKRVTYWPQFVLGLAFNWGALMGPAAIISDVPLEAFILYAAGISWTLGYDTIYAHQDKTDDAIVGVKSSALALGDKTKPAITCFYILTILLIGLVFYRLQLSPFSFIGLGLAAIHFYRQIIVTDLDDPKACLKTFKANRDAGFLIAFGLALG